MLKYFNMSKFTTFDLRSLALALPLALALALHDLINAKTVSRCVLLADLKKRLAALKQKWPMGKSTYSDTKQLVCVGDTVHASGLMMREKNKSTGLYWTVICNS